MKTHIYLLLIFTGISFTACQNEEAPVTITQDEEANTTLTTMIEGLPLIFTTPNELASSTPSILFNGTLGWYEVKLSKDLMFVISEEEISIEDVKAELREDHLFSYKFYDEGPNSLLYQAVLPDGSDYLYQYVRTMKVGDKNYLIHSDKNREFSLQNIHTLKATMNSIVPI